MSELNHTLVSVLAGSFSANAARIRELAAPLSQEQFWNKPFSFGNSFGHLVLHMTGNLNYYVGAQIAETGYVRDRPREFNEADFPAKEDALRAFDDAVGMVIRTIQSQSAEDWAKSYSAERTKCSNRLEMVAQCAAHMQHHIGQMIYLSYEWEQQATK